MDTLTGRFAIGGFCTGLLAGGLITLLLGLITGDSLTLPFALTAGGAAGAWYTLGQEPAPAVQQAPPPG